MKLKLLTQNKKLSTLLLNNLSYLGDEPLAFKSEQQSIEGSDESIQFEGVDSLGIFIIVSRKHYQESWHTYSAISLKELKSILKIKNQSHHGLRLIQKIIENKEQDGFDVKTIIFDSALVSSLPKQSILIPETELLEHFIDNKRVFEISTPTGILFWGYSGKRSNSAYRKGLLTSSTSFIQSVGLPLDSTVETISIGDYSTLLYELFISTNINSLYSIASINISSSINPLRFHQLYLAPLVVATLFVLGVNGYYFIQSGLLDAQIKEASQQTFALVSKKNEVDEARKTLKVINQEFSTIKPTHSMWELVRTSTENGMEISRFKRYDKGVELRGTAEKASEILSELDKLPQVKEASFVGSIRKSRGKDLFTILLQVDDELANSKQGENL